MSVGTPEVVEGGSESAVRCETVHVRPAGGREYPVVVATRLSDAAKAAGVVDRLLEANRSATPGVVIVGDAAVAAVHGRTIREALGCAGAPWLTFPAGEGSKNRDTVARLQDDALAAGVERGTIVVAAGGGVSTDIGGFVAATLLRGLRWIAVPTTLVGAVDAAVGGKTGIDTPAGKNLVGAFHHPEAVVAGADLLATLPPAERRAGWAETIKHAVVADARLFETLEAAGRERPGRADEGWSAGELVGVVARSAAVKAAVVTEDPLERGRRAILNFGHTVGHALEAVTRYRMTHGEAVAAGMAAEARIAVAIGLLPEDARNRIERVLEAFGLPVRVTDVAASALGAAMATDKKRRGGEVRFSLPAGLGEVRPHDGSFTRPVAAERVEAALREIGCSA